MVNTAAVSAEDQVIAWCTGCKRYLPLSSQRRDSVVLASQEHTFHTGHGVWLEAAGGTQSRIVGERRYDPARSDDYREERLRGGA